LNGYFPFAVPKTKEEWQARAEKVRRQILVSQGLWPLPTKTPLNVVIHGKIDEGSYTVEKVCFESMPGFYVTGNLYRPKNVSGKVPGALVPHGHWANGRFYDAGRLNVRKEIVQGAERFEEGGRSPLQPLPVQLARMGCVSFHYDMLGYADSTQLSLALVHGFKTQRPDMNAAENWGLFSPQAESHLQSAMGLQTWNSIRALDFLLSLPEIDAERIAVTGASGGGTQTFLLAAIDPRVTLAFPAVMVSTAMQGGCTCENASCLRVDTGNVEFAALFAPKPQGLTAADDWTKEMATKGFPELRQLYDLLGAPKNVELFSYTHFGHNYNYVSRSSFYAFINKHFQLGLEEPVVAEDHRWLPREEITVWDVQHPQPAGGDDFERKLLHYWAQDAGEQLAAIVPKDAASLAEWRKVVGGGIEAIIGRGAPAAGEVELEKSEKTDLGDYFRFAGLLRNKTTGTESPVAFLHPKQWNKQVVLWLNEQGKAGIFDAEGNPSPDAKRLMDAGYSVAGIDLLFQGEFLAPDEAAPVNRRVDNNRQFAGYTYGYNHSLVAQRAHDVLTALAFIKYDDQQAEGTILVSLDGTAPVAAIAASQSNGLNVKKIAIDTKGFRFHGVKDYLDANFLPGGAKYLDVLGMLSLATEPQVWLAGETDESAAFVNAAQAAVGKPAGLVLEGEASDVKAAALEWLTKQP
jgi:dienelactone hydrolase